MSEWVPVSKAAQIRKCSERTIYNLAKKWVLQSKKEGGRLLVLMDVPEDTSEVDPKFSEVLSVLRVQLEEKDKQIDNLQKQLEDASHRHDTIVLQLTRQMEQSQKLLEYQSGPFYRRWFKKKRKEDLS